ncbi:ChaN family lipoprotein [Azospirillum oleiclasticum]|uniref:ChaN family lipoprotein n=1 Tax=Azospirillum oleiclasticum TaxID=2735135 RepID=UPI0031B5974C
MRAALVLTLFLAACVGEEPAVRHAAAAESASGLCVAPGFWATGAGRPLETAGLIARAARAPAVLLGEHHDSPEHHRWQLQTIAAIHARNPDIAIGLEMFPRRAQPALDRWTAGQTGEAEFLRESDWDRVWGYPAELYLPILHFARMNRIPLVALNVERALVSRTAREGWAAIPAADREGVGNPARPTDAYLERLSEAMAAHGPGERQSAGFQRFVEAQSVWDRAMAERIAETSHATGRTVVAIMGMAHVEGRNGVPHQLADLGIADAVVLLPWEAARGCEDLDDGLADAVFGLGPVQGAETPRPRLGVRLEDTAEGAVIRAVQAGGVADAAGLKPGDVVTAAAGTPVRRAADLTAAVQRQPPGTWLPLTIARDRAVRDVVAKFPAAPGG